MCLLLRNVQWTNHIELELQAVAIVSSCGACSQPVVSASGPAMKRGLVAPNAGEITVSGGYGLACSHIIHTTCCKGNGGKGEEVGIFVMIRFAFANFQTSASNRRNLKIAKIKMQLQARSE